MKIFYSFYELRFNKLDVKREGALLKIIYSNGSIGFADCHPWPELGDLPLREHLTHLSQGSLTPLIRCSLELAQIDADARSKKETLLSQKKIPRSHFLVTNILNITNNDVQHWIQEGYTHIKVKMGKEIGKEIKTLISLFSQSSLILRLDFNETLNFSSFLKILDQLDDLKKLIEFIEDPFPFDSQQWQSIQNEGWVLACDRQIMRGAFQPGSAKILIIKPGLQSSLEWRQFRQQRCLVTSSLGHPMDQLAAAYVATQIDSIGQYVHGLNSHLVYHPSVFSQQLSWHGPEFQIPLGFGFGFDEQLQNIEWTPLS